MEWSTIPAFGALCARVAPELQTPAQVTANQWAGAQATVARCAPYVGGFGDAQALHAEADRDLGASDAVGPRVNAPARTRSVAVRRASTRALPGVSRRSNQRATCIRLARRIAEGGTSAGPPKPAIIVGIAAMADRLVATRSGMVPP